MRRALLICGILSSLLYLVSRSERAERNWRADRIAVVWLGSVYTALVAAFGWGIWKSGSRNRVIQVVGALILTRINISVFLLWVAVLATALLRISKCATTPGDGTCAPRRAVSAP